MALTESDLSELLTALKAGQMTDTIPTSLEWILNQLIDAEATAVIGDLDLKIPRLPEGSSFFPSLLERRRRIDRTLFAVVMEAYVHGISTRKVDDL